MAFSFARVRVFAPAAALAMALTPLAANAQGFGKIKKKVTLRRKLPAVAHLTGTKISVKAKAESSKNGDTARVLHDILEAEILKSDHQLTVNNTAPDTLITCTITSISTPAPQKVTRKVASEKGLKDQQFTEVSGSLRVAYEATNPRSGQVIDAYNVSEDYQHEFEGQGGGNVSTKTYSDIRKQIGHIGKIIPGKKASSAAGGEPDVPPTTTQLEQLLVERAAKEITTRLVDTDETVEVQLARGKLDDANQLAEQGLWSRMAEQLETMDPLPKPEDDAYRLYNLGVAYEAQGYEAKDPKAARHFLQQAAIDYGKAIDDNKGEKYFLEPQQRIETAMAHYKVLEGRPTTASTPPASQQPASGSSPSSPASSGKATAGTAPRASSRRHSSTEATKTASQSGGAKPLTNDDVIALAKAGMEEENLLATIREAKAVNFDMSTQGQVNLLHNGIKGKVLAAMRERARRSSP